MGKPLSRATRENLFGYTFIGIWILGFFIFMLYPLLTSIIYSLSDVKLTADGIVSKFVGFKNYIDLFKIEKGFEFIEALTAYLRQMVLQIPVIIVFSILIALLLNQKIKSRGIFRSIFFLPVIISSGPVINELIEHGAGGTNIFESYGFITIIQNSLSTDLAKPIVDLFSQIIIIFWFSGVQILIFLAGLQKIDQQIYEAAQIDGAGPWQAFWKITMPSLSSLILVNSIYTIVLLSTFSENKVILSIKSNLFNSVTGFGMASAMAWMYALIVFLAIGLVGLLFRSRQPRRRY
ncbi:sugar ABC transporter permease [Acholeplasma vituli]|uniref:Sugar ABC transporter permease n=1 Tax=Paracholeplasma vituli TaxID=69473 RepID=A0ABT2PXK4_9MOLU|nr:sugar ABC transporter permease [Paracholeplasma vituli]MCU0105181.1 sugar ABC transporter permease [Paracholeplasma vituli]